MIFTPEATHVEVMAIYPSARIEPLSELPRRAASPDEASELRELVALIYAAGDDAERTEALGVALADPEAALELFRALAADRGLGCAARLI